MYDKELFSALINDDLPKITSLIENNPELLGTFNDSAETIIHKCIREDRKEIFDYLLTLDWEENGVILTAALHYAEQLYDLYYFRKLLDKCGVIGCISILHSSASSDNLEALQLLIDRGVDIDGTLKDYWTKTPTTALALAIRFEKLEIVQALLYYGVDVFVDPKIDYFFLALFVENYEIQELLVNYCFDNLEPLDMGMLIQIHCLSISPTITEMILRSIDTITYNTKLDLKELNVGFRCLLEMSHEPALNQVFNKLHYFTRCEFLQHMYFVFAKYYIAIEEYEERYMRIFDRLVQDYVRTYRGSESIFPILKPNLSEEKIYVLGMIALSHGLEVCTTDFFKVYSRSNANKLFKFMLNLKIKNLPKNYVGPPPYSVILPVPALIFDTNLTIEKLLWMPQLDLHHSFVHHVLDLTALPRFKRRIFIKFPEIVIYLDQSPDVPSLMEFCRNFIRDRIIEKSNVTSVYDFRKILSTLHLPPVLIDVLCFTRNLYNVTCFKYLY